MLALPKRTINVLLNCASWPNSALFGSGQIPQCADTKAVRLRAHPSGVDCSCCLIQCSHTIFRPCDDRESLVLLWLFGHFRHQADPIEAASPHFALVYTVLPGVRAISALLSSLCCIDLSNSLVQMRKSRENGALARH